VLLPGKDMIAAGYCMYGSSCTVINQLSWAHVTQDDWSSVTTVWTVCASNLLQLVLSTGSGVNGFTLDPSLGEFIMTHPEIKVPWHKYGGNLFIFLKIHQKVAYSYFVLCASSLADTC
jgi:fructose-1,6-bisphosphatase I